MQQQGTFGKLIYQSKTNKAKTKIYVAIAFIFILAVLAVGIYMFINPELLAGEPDEIATFLPIFMVVAPFLFALITLVAAKAAQYTRELYETGVIFKSGSGALASYEAFAFDEILGVQHYIVRNIDITPGMVIPSKARKVTVILRNVKQLYKGDNPIKSNFQNKDRYEWSGEHPFTFLEKFIVQYTAYIVKDLNKQNIGQAEIRFGTDVMLKNGQFIYKNGEIVLPLSETSRVTSDKLPLFSSKINLRSIDESGREKKAITIPIDQAMNVDALYCIINDLR